ncbi:MAG: CBS domain-containing protein [Acidimicrobiia bacterium]
MHTVEGAMTEHVVTVWPEASATVAARIMRDVGVSGLPVVDGEGCVVGILTEADLLHRAVVADPAEIDTKPRVRDWPSATVADLMSRDVLGLRRDDPLAKAARLMEKARVRRLVVVGDGFALEGIISRSDVVAALARSDADIGAEIRTRVIDQVLGLDPEDLDVSVSQGVVSLIGVVAQRREAVRLERLVGRVLGVSSVESAVRWKADTMARGRRPRFALFANTGGEEGTRSEAPAATELDDRDRGATSSDEGAV